MRESLKLLHKRWEANPHKRIVAVNAVLSLLAVGLAVEIAITAKTRYEACFHGGIAVGVVVIWLRYGYEKFIS